MCRSTSATSRLRRVTTWSPIAAPSSSSPPTNIARVLDAAERIVAREDEMAKHILSGNPIGSVMGGNYEHMLKR